ncbi:prolyl oligopeptidase family serine peptidase [Saprospiraceae bacterium]|jgi:dipeptidyl aminopeptidase/acylaminoacyl peptidase|nr:prolyl oligopeptidase family serine peptidase [Bacteroidota bacterium]MDB4728193.1 prolyl oligopeptidase family serine peptidase [Saprospiraceae bacterium]
MKPMLIQSIKGLSILGAIIVGLLLHNGLNSNECENRISYDDIHINDDINLDSLFAPTDSLELAKIRKDWESFNPQSESFQILSEYRFLPERNIVILEHFAEERTHYGAILFPYQYDESKKYPVAVWAAGLNQSDPSVTLKNTPIRKFPPNYFVIVPSFPGQALVADNKTYCSDGFFGDAFDGATDDAIRLLELAKTAFNGLDQQRIAVAGGSRGGTVALLMAARDTSINVCASIADPVDFFNRDPYERYGFQFKYQFLNERKPISELRAKMLKSAPVYFIENYSNALFIIHGKNDQVVPIVNAERVIEKFKERDNFDYLLANSGHRVPEMHRLIEWIKTNN